MPFIVWFLCASVQLVDFELCCQVSSLSKALIFNITFVSRPHSPPIRDCFLLVESFLIMAFFFCCEENSLDGGKYIDRVKGDCFADICQRVHLKSRDFVGSMYFIICTIKSFLGSRGGYLIFPVAKSIWKMALSLLRTDVPTQRGRHGIGHSADVRQCFISI